MWQNLKGVYNMYIEQIEKQTVKDFAKRFLKKLINFNGEDKYRKVYVRQFKDKWAVLYCSPYSKIVFYMNDYSLWFVDRPDCSIGSKMWQEELKNIFGDKYTKDLEDYKKSLNR